MSEFTNGVAFLQKDKTTITGHIKSVPSAHAIKDLNTQWSVLLLEQIIVKGEPLHQWLLDVSKHLPLLIFANAEDHGWGYELLNDGEEIAFLAVGYDELFEALDSDTDMNALVKDILQRANVTQFHVFGLSDEVITRLESIMSVKWLTDENRILHQVEAFKKALNITELSWMSYHYLEIDGELDDEL